MLDDVQFQIFAACKWKRELANLKEIECDFENSDLDQ
jgi:hypothetical protein